MATETWDKIFRQVATRANMLASATPSSLQTAYVSTSIGQAQLLANASEFPKEGIDDAILDAADVMLQVIGLDPQSRYRGYFSDTTAALTSGQPIPIVGSSGKNRVGVIGSVVDGTLTTRKLHFREYVHIENSENILSALRPFWFYTDNFRIWHTRDTAVADIVVWDKEAQRTLMAATPRGLCPFPVDLHEGLICGGLSYLFKGNFNIEQVDRWRQYFNETLIRCGINHKEQLLRRENGE